MDFTRYSLRDSNATLRGWFGPTVSVRYGTRLHLTKFGYFIIPLLFILESPYSGISVPLQVNSYCVIVQVRVVLKRTVVGDNLQSTENFIDAIKTVQIPDDYKLVSFDVKSLFTSIPLQLALQCTETLIQQSTVKLPLLTEEIMDLLNLCLTSTFFQYNGKHYKQLHGTAMGSPVSVVVAEIVMQHMEERALATYRQTIPLWLSYVDDTVTAVHKDEIDDFHDHLNEQIANIQFTKEIEENGKLPFLDCLASSDNNELRTTVYRKPTHTNRLLDQSSYNPTSSKATTIKTLTR